MESAIINIKSKEKQTVTLLNKFCLYKIISENKNNILILLESENIELVLLQTKKLFKTVEIISKPEIMNLKAFTQRSDINFDDNIVIAGPCSIDSEENLLKTAEFLKSMNIKYLRGGAFKPRTSPYSFQGMEKKGIEILHKISKQFNLTSVSELTDIRNIDIFAKYIDIIQIGARNMYNYPLLKEAGKTMKPIILKRHFSATFKEWILAGEYILNTGSSKLIFCERGIRVSNNNQNILDINSIVKLKQLSDFPVIADVSHSAGYREFVPALIKTAFACGADGIMAEIHPLPENAKSDSFQSLDFSEFQNAMKSI